MNRYVKRLAACVMVAQVWGVASVEAAGAVVARDVQGTAGLAANPRLSHVVETKAKNSMASGAGEAVYKKSCKMCHGEGVLGAPRMGDKAAWAPRVAQGIDTLHAHALKGFGKMQAKGGNPALADDDVRGAVNYMVAHSK